MKLHRSDSNLLSAVFGRLNGHIRSIDLRSIFIRIVYTASKAGHSAGLVHRRRGRLNHVSLPISVTYLPIKCRGLCAGVNAGGAGLKGIAVPIRIPDRPCDADRPTVEILKGFAAPELPSLGI